MPRETLTDFERGLVTGLLIGEGSFTGDGTGPAIQVKMHVRHERLLRWLHDLVPGSKLYGPYIYEPRRFFIWVLRQREVIRWLVAQLSIEEMDDQAGARLRSMLDRYEVC